MSGSVSNIKVFLGTISILSLAGVTFYIGKKKDGHNLFDVNKPAAVQARQDELERKRLSK